VRTCVPIWSPLGRWHAQRIYSRARQQMHVAWERERERERDRRKDTSRAHFAPRARGNRCAILDLIGKRAREKSSDGINFRRKFPRMRFSHDSRRGWTHTRSTLALRLICARDAGPSADVLSLIYWKSIRLRRPSVAPVDYIIITKCVNEFSTCWTRDRSRYHVALLLVISCMRVQRATWIFRGTL
jgi:hypothetical protein